MGCQCAAVYGVEDKRPRRFHLGKPVRSSKINANSRRAENILAGLPADVMDELVDDVAEAVVAVVLRQAATQTDEEDDASSGLRKI